MAKIYVSSSWKNEFQPQLVEELRKRGHEVYDFRHPNGRNDRNVWELYYARVGLDDCYRQDVVVPSVFRESLVDEEVHRRFSEHYNAMLEADVCVLLLPCGRSSHVEAGFMKGKGKDVFILDTSCHVIPELMYLCFDDYFYEINSLLDALDNR